MTQELEYEKNLLLPIASNQKKRYESWKKGNIVSVALESMPKCRNELAMRKALAQLKENFRKSLEP